MSDKKVVKPVALAVGAALAGSFALTGVVAAKSADSPFAMSSLESGYMLGLDSTTGDKKDKGGEGSCGEGSCGEGSCGHSKDKGSEGSCGEGSCGHSKGKGSEGSCGEGSCGHSKDKGSEGSCGEGSCGGSV